MVLSKRRHDSVQIYEALRINGRRYEKRKNSLDAPPILEKRLGTPAPLCGDDIRVHPLQQKLCSPPNPESVPWQSRKALRLPDLVATLDEIRAGERGPTGRGGRTKREQRSGRREGRIDRHVSLKGRERTSAMRTSSDGNIGPPLLGGLCPRNMKGRSTSGIGKSMDGEREHRTRDVLEHIEKTDTGNDELAQAMGKINKMYMRTESGVRSGSNTKKAKKATALTAQSKGEEESRWSHRMQSASMVTGGRLALREEGGTIFEKPLRV